MKWTGHGAAGPRQSRPIGEVTRVHAHLHTRRKDTCIHLWPLHVCEVTLVEGLFFFSFFLGVGTDILPNGKWFYII